jgi:uncharacterized protein YegP (UPF0339 family)
MSEADIREGKLIELYHRYVGEPESKRDVYGYWVFLLGSLMGIGGVFIAIVGEALFTGSEVFTFRRPAIMLASMGLSVGLLGILILLPVRRRALLSSIAGLLLTVGSVVMFAQVYPNNWNPEGGSDPIMAGLTPEPLVLGIYAAGISIITGVAVMVPILTGEKGLLVEPELGVDSDSPPVLVGDATRDAFFAVFELPTNDWAWRIIQRDAVGESAQVEPTDTDARMAIEDVRDQFGRAGLLEITTAAFRLHQNDEGEWHWSLVRDDGSVVAESYENLPNRDEAESTASFLKDEIPNANVLEIRSAAFDVYQDERGRWHWRLLDDRREPIAMNTDSYSNEVAADGGTKEFVKQMQDPRVLAVETIAIELFQDGSEWRWRVVDDQDRALVTSTESYATEPDAEEHAEQIAAWVEDAVAIEHGTLGYEVYRDETDWNWRLRDSSDDIIAELYGPAADENEATALAEETRESVRNADIVEFRGADYEVYPENGSWHWRLVSADRQVLADSTIEFDSKESAMEAAERVREQALAADLLEFEQAAFQQYESGGEWRWRLIDEDGRVMADSGESYDSKDEVMDGMTTLKENAPNAEVLEIDTAAFEIYLTESEDYAWRLIDEAGKLVAECAETYNSRAAARDAVDYLLTHVDDADVRPMEDAAFQLHTKQGSWQFWLVATDGTLLAEGTKTYSTRDEARRIIKTFTEAGEEVPIDTMGPVTVQLKNGSGWHWRLIDRQRELIADGDRTYESRNDALADVKHFIDHAREAPFFQFTDSVLWISQNEAGWEWELLNDQRNPVAASPDPFEGQNTAEKAVEYVMSRAPDAGTFDFDVLAFELFVDQDDEWRWELLDAKENTLGVSPLGYETREEAEDVIDEMRGLVGRASILEIDEAAYEFHKRDGGWIWRLVDENGTPLAESVEPHDGRQEAREEMLTVKEHAPDGETVVTW